MRVCLCPVFIMLSCSTILRIWGSKPISNIRSASSRTKNLKKDIVEAKKRRHASLKTMISHKFYMTTYRYCLTCNVQEKSVLFLTYQQVFLVLLQEDDIHDQDHAFVLLHSHHHTRRKDEHVIDMKTFAIRQKSRLFE